MMSLQVALIGATGLVGQEFLRIAADRPDLRIQGFASRARAEQGIADFQDLLRDPSPYRYVINAADSEQARQIAPRLAPGQCLIDNSSAYRMDPEVPLVVPEINAHCLRSFPRIVANPNCTAALLCLTLAPLRKWKLKRVVVSTYQAASGAGLKAVDELVAQIKSWAQDPSQALRAEVFPFPLFLNVMSHNTPIRQEAEGLGYNDEEWKVLSESRKILGLADLAISATCVRVPVLRAHTESVTVDLEENFQISEVLEALRTAPGLVWQHDEERRHFPMPIDTQGRDAVAVGRLRRDPFLPRTLHFLLSGDQLRKGAALNAFQIMVAMESERA